MLRSTIGLIRILLVLSALAGLILLNVNRILSDDSISAGTLRGLQLAGIGALVTAGLMFLFQRPLQKALDRLLTDAAVMTRTIWQKIAAWTKSEPRLNQAALSGLTLLAAILRLLFITQPIRTDEALTYLQFASKPLYLALSDYAAPNNHLFHTFLVFITTHLFGNSEIAIRLPAFVAGVLLVPLTYMTFRRLYRTDGALLAAGLVAVSSVWIEYSTNARGYTLQAALFLAIIRLAFFLRTSRNTAAWGLFAVLNALAFYTLPTMLYGFGMVMLWLLASMVIEQRGTERIALLTYWFASGVSSAIFTLALYTPVLIVSGVSAVTGNVYVTGKDDFWQQMPASLAATWAQWHRDIPLPVAILLAIGFGLALIGHSRIARFRVPLLIPGALWIIAVVLIQRVVPFTRVWLFLLPVYFGMAAAGLAALAEGRDRRLWRVLVVLIPLWGAMLVVQSRSPYTSTETGTFRDAEIVTAYIQEHLKSGDKVIYEHPSGESLMYYFRRHDAPADIIERDFAAHDVLYLVLNQEYPQTTESVLRSNGQNPNDYTVRLLEQFPLSALYVAEHKPG